MNNWIKSFKMDEQLCKDIIKVFESDAVDGSPGLSSNKVQPHIKDSMDCSFSKLDFTKLWTKYYDSLMPEIYKYAEKARVSNITLEMANVQRYKPGQGFRQLHYERDVFIPYRCFVFMTYLNDVPNGGTHFPEQDYTAEAITGNTLIWPAEFTHPHVGQISEEHTKYIVTGWFIYVDPLNNGCVRLSAMDEESHPIPIYHKQYTIIGNTFDKQSNWEIGYEN